VQGSFSLIDAETNNAVKGYLKYIQSVWCALAFTSIVSVLLIIPMLSIVTCAIPTILTTILRQADFLLLCLAL
jgi:hypothetical protein